jgi:hypothetical protein
MRCFGILLGARSRRTFHNALTRAGAGVLLESYKEFWPVAMSQPAKLNMAGFVLYLLGGFVLRCSQHPAVSSQRSAKNQHQKRFTTEDTESREEGRTYARVPASAVSAPDDCAKPTPFWDHLGCGGIPREGGGAKIG